MKMKSLARISKGKPGFWSLLPMPRPLRQPQGSSAPGNAGRPGPRGHGEEKSGKCESASAPAEKTGEIDIDTFKKAEMKTGIIRFAERHQRRIASCAWKLILEKAKPPDIVRPRGIL